MSNMGFFVFFALAKTDVVIRTFSRITFGELSLSGYSQEIHPKRDTFMRSGLSFAK